MDKLAFRSGKKYQIITLQMKACRIRINGIVQGVGFRPFVYRIANENNIKGWVQNTSGGVVIEAEGGNENLKRFSTELKQELPPLARIETFKEEMIHPNGYEHFEIKSSEKIPQEYSLVAPDAAICPDCARELFDPSDRRFRYPFINCTNCGPRFSIITDMPYDRPFTTMASFEMCTDCRKEYHNPSDRRFHAQPIACPVCGPQIALLSRNGILAEKEEALQSARMHIKEGKIIAVKGIGGYLLACDAHDQRTIQLLRERKRRSLKPFGLMAFSEETIRKYCLVNDAESRILHSMQMPLVLLEKNNINHLPREIAPSQISLGFMLPYTPLHLLLCEPEIDFPDVLVMTSANISDEPILYRDSEMNRLFELADYILTHNRPIHIRTDDSVVRVFSEVVLPVRRSRGIAPEPVSLPDVLPEILAVGAHLKNTITLTRSKRAFVSPYIGDLENIDTYEAFQTTISHLEKLFQIKPAYVVSDLHPNYLSTQFASEYSQEKEIPLQQIQHHHAHLAACLAENNWNGQNAIGLCFDGTGYGNDGGIWGGEILIGNYLEYIRYAHLDYLPLPGGDTSIKKPYRIALAYLNHSNISLAENLAPVQFCPSAELSLLNKQVTKKINTIYSSSMGRLFDAVSSIIGICHEVSYEGQAAIELENLADPLCTERYLVSATNPTIDIRALLEQIVTDVQHEVSTSTISAKFHNTIALFCLDICRKIRKETGINEVALSGGVWQNITLLRKSNTLLTQDGFITYNHQILPANDGCISYGQAVIAGMQMKGRE